MGVVGRWRAFRCLGGGGLVARGPLRTDNDHGASVVRTLVLCWLQHHHTLCVLFAQSVQRNHCADRPKVDPELNTEQARTNATRIDGSNDRLYYL